MLFELQATGSSVTNTSSFGVLVIRISERALLIELVRKYSGFARKTKVLTNIIKTDIIRGIR